MNTTLSGLLYGLKLPLDVVWFERCSLRVVWFNTTTLGLLCGLNTTSHCSFSAMDALWRILGLHGVPPKLINLMSELYFGTESAVRGGDTISDKFPVVPGVC